MTNATAQKRLYNINGTVTNVKVGETDGKEVVGANGEKTIVKTPYATFTLVHDNAGKDGKPKKTLVDAYGKAALKVIEGGFAQDGAKIRVGGVYSDESRKNKDTGKDFRIAIFHLVHCETPKTAEEIAALKAAKAARVANQGELQAA